MNIKLGTTGQYLAPGGEENLRIIRGVFDFNGSIIVGSGFTVSHTGNGVYSVTFNTAFSGPPAVAATGDQGSVISIRGDTASSVSFQSQTISTGELGDGTIHFIAIGPR